MPSYKSTTLDEIYNFLKKFHLSDSLYFIGLVNALFRLGYREIIDYGIPKSIVEWVEANYKTDISRMSLWLTLTRMARFFLLSKAHDHKELAINTEYKYLIQALYLCSNLHEKEIDGKMTTEQEVNQVFSRIGQWQFPLQSFSKTVVGRGYYLFIRLPSEHSINYNFDAKFREYFDIGVKEFMVSGVSLYMTARGAILEDEPILDIENSAYKITSKDIKKFIQLSSGTAQDYRKMVRGEDWMSSNKMEDIYGLDPFVRMPLVKVTKSFIQSAYSGELYTIPQPIYLLERANSGVFYLLADRERFNAELNNNNTQNNFRRDFGNVYREYVSLYLRQAQSPVFFIDLDKENITNGKKPDFALINDNICLLFEVKTSLLSVNSRSIFDIDKIKGEIKMGSFQKAIIQLETFKNSILKGEIKDNRFSNVSKIVSILVGYEDIYTANGILLPLLKEHYQEKVLDFQIATVSDIESIGALLAKEYNLLEILSQKVVTKAEYNIAQYIQSETNDGYYNQILEKGYEAFMTNCMGLP